MVLLNDRKEIHFVILTTEMSLHHETIRARLNYAKTHILLHPKYNNLFITQSGIMEWPSLLTSLDHSFLVHWNSNTIKKITYLMRLR